MKKRYQVFVSSTYEDLWEERQEVIQALLELDCIPTGMELFPAADDDSWSLIKGLIEECDYYIVIVAGRYGSLGPEGKSFTEMEYEFAVEKRIPVIGFLHGDPGKIVAEKGEETEKGRAALAAFRKSIENRRHCKYWSSTKDLGGVVSRGIANLIKTKPGVGWVRANLVPDESASQQILRLRDQIVTFQYKLAEVSPPKDTEHLAQGNEEISLTFHYFVQEFPTRLQMSFTWNHLFAALVPLLLDGATEDQMRNKLCELFVNKMADQAGVAAENPSIREEDFQRVKVQLWALGLIKKKVDAAESWTLTPYGTNRVIQDAAIRSSQMVLPIPD